MYRWAKIFQLSKAIGKINFSFLNFRYKLKERPDAYVIVLSCFVLSIISVFYYYYFQMLGQLYDGLSELGLGALFCTVRSANDTLDCERLPADQRFLFFKGYRTLAAISCEAM